MVVDQRGCALPRSRGQITVNAGSLKAQCVTTSTNPAYFPCDPSFKVELEGIAGAGLLLAFAVAMLLIVVKAVR